MMEMTEEIDQNAGQSNQGKKLTFFKESGNTLKWEPTIPIFT